MGLFSIPMLVSSFNPCRFRLEEVSSGVAFSAWRGVSRSKVRGFHNHPRKEGYSHIMYVISIYIYTYIYIYVCTCIYV